MKRNITIVSLIAALSSLFLNLSAQNNRNGSGAFVTGQYRNLFKEEAIQIRKSKPK